MSARVLSNIASNRRALYQQAMQASIRARIEYNADLKRPICIYDLCKARGVTVRFNAINMEGMYDRIPQPRIHLSALRPLVRRTFNCAHELGHHEFGHGSTIDELREGANADRWKQPNEVLADAFAAFILMPTLGLREAFAQRRLTPERAKPAQFYAIACNFGVGFSTLVTHMALGIEEMTPFHRATLARHTPRSIRTEFLGQPTAEPLVLVDERWNAPSLDVEEGHTANPFESSSWSRPWSVYYPPATGHCSSLAASADKSIHNPNNARSSARVRTSSSQARNCVSVISPRCTFASTTAPTRIFLRVSAYRARCDSRRFLRLSRRAADALP